MQLATYACEPNKTRGRLILEEPSLFRNNFQMDRDRIVHSNAFRRLEYKTQVFVNHEGDHYRNRLTHSMEVAILARLIARALGVSEDLSEAIALAHDMGHTPFGHAGEEALDECMKEFGGFDHNAHSIKLLTQLEDRYASFDGLNLSWEVLEGIAKHNGPLTGDLPLAIKEYNDKHDLELNKFSSIEAQVAALADDIAYHSHDIEDGIRAGLLTIEDLESIEIMSEFVSEIKAKHPNIPFGRLVYEITRKLTHYLVTDLITTTRANITNNNIVSERDVREFSKALVAFSPKVEEENKRIKSLLFEKVYLEHKVMLMKVKAQKVIKELFALCMEKPDSMPLEWQRRITENTTQYRARVISDYIAGMTDRYAIREFESFFNLSSNRYF
ncbi:MAG: deoxyguanosinetriphosphate triphosphohydrolase [Rickettsiaceae bacterium]|jgi:dGTPase|nr:deoxyguanosinetriphosphate triphosphohydrolase [Rickettsiaceae bacterium]